MRVLHITDSYLPTVGGIEIHVHERAERQRQRGVDAHILTTSPAGSHDDPTWVHRVDREALPSATAATNALARTLTSLDPDVLHIHASVVSPFAWLGVRQAAARRVPSVVTTHSMWSGYGPLPTAAGWILGLRSAPVVWSAVSARAAQPVQRIVGSRARVHVLPNAVDPAQWLPREVTPTGDPVVVAVMRLTKVKRTMPLLRMLAALPSAAPGARAIVIGEGPEAGAAEEFVAAKGLRGVVELPGRLDHAQIREILTRASVFIAPAERESFGIAPLEARTLGLPIVASSRSGVSEFITHGVDGFLGADDTAMLAHLTRLLTDQTLLGRVSEHNRLIPPMHTWEHTEAVADALYAQAIQVAAVRARTRRTRRSRLAAAR